MFQCLIDPKEEEIECSACSGVDDGVGRWRSRDLGLPVDRSFRVAPFIFRSHRAHLRRLALLVDPFLSFFQFWWIWGGSIVFSRPSFLRPAALNKRTKTLSAGNI